MCYATKRKIADCVKHLMRHKDISKITIQDIMDATCMSRQSFYYHFKDIYDVLEWIGIHDFQKQISSIEYTSMDAWVCDLLKTISAEHIFYEKIVSEIEWPRIVIFMKNVIHDQIARILAAEKTLAVLKQTAERDACMDFFSISFCYYILDYIYRKRKFDEKKICADVRFIMAMLEKSESEQSPFFVLPKAMPV